MMRGSAHAQRMRMCADNVPSACIMRECVFCADYAQMRMVRMCACAVLRMCGAAQHVHRRSKRICACVLLRSLRRGRAHRGEAKKRSIFLRILEREGDSSQKQ